MSGLSVNPLSYYSSYYPQKNATSAQTAYQNLGASLRSGDLSGAQVAFASLQQANQGGMNSSVAADMNNLGSALTAGNLSAAQSSFAQLHQDVSAQRLHQYQPAAGGIGGTIGSLLSQLLPSALTSTASSSTSTAASAPTTPTSPGTLNVQA
jgi:hypothetical protein